MSLPDGSMRWVFPRLALWLCDYMESLMLSLVHGSTKACKTCCCPYEELDKTNLFDFRTDADREEKARLARRVAEVYEEQERAKLTANARGPLSESARKRLRASGERAYQDVMKSVFGYKPDCDVSFGGLSCCARPFQCYP